MHSGFLSDDPETSVPSHNGAVESCTYSSVFSSCQRLSRLCGLTLSKVVPPLFAICLLFFIEFGKVIIIGLFINQIVLSSLCVPSTVLDMWPSKGG